MKFRTIYVQLFCLILLFLLSSNSLSQDSQTDDKLRSTKYISAEKDAETRPRVAIAKRKSIERVPAKEIRQIRANDYDLEKKAFQLINDKRIENGLKPLVWQDKIADLARQHSQNMARYSFFSHIGLNGRTVDQRALDSGLNKWNAIGENIAYNKGFENPAEFAVDRWMLSDGHRKNLLDPRWTESGIGLSITDDGMYFFCQIFILNQ